MRLNKRALRLIGATLALLALGASVWAGSPAFSARPSYDRATHSAVQPQAQGQAPGVTTASDSARTRISTTIRDKAGQVDVVVLHNISSKAALLSIAPTLHTRAYTLADGSTESFGTVDASLLLKIASVGGVTWVGGARDGQPAIAPPDDPNWVVVPNQQPVKKAGATPKRAVISDGYQDKGGPVRPEDWFDVDVEHNARQAWQNGYDGTGVVVAVADSGVDFGHPDLQGTFARINGGPYAGWPYAYDNFGTAYWETFGAAQTVDNWNGNFISYYVDTSRTVSAPPGVTSTAVITTPLWSRDGAVSHNYTLPTTSKSGTIHVGFHPDASLGAGWFADGGQPAIAVVDEHTAGVYDTVYVDLDGNYQFDSYETQTKANPVNALDWTGDGLADQSAGLLFWVADGTHGNPGAYLWSNSPRVAGAGDLVGFMFTNDVDPNIGSAHGLLCASDVIGQGITNGADIAGNPPSPLKPAGEGVLWGTANKAKLAAFTVYSLYDFGLTPNLYGVLGPDGQPNTGDEINISSNSYGSSNIDNDGWDTAAREYASYNYDLNPNLTFVMSTGNGAPGYGTITPPGGANTVVGVGASTSYGSVTDLEAITRTDQINWGNTASFSGRGPTSAGRWGPSVLANGNVGVGAVPINQVGDGNSAHEAWSGTSRSTPVTAGIIALIYDAYKTAHGRYPTYSESRQILMSSANYNGHDPFAEGAGVVDALRATNAASDNGGLVASPSAWQPGSYNGITYGQDANFANVMKAGSTASSVISVTNASGGQTGLTMSATTLQVSQVMTFALSTNSSAESPWSTKRPDYLVHLFQPGDIPADTVLMVEQLVFPYEQFNPALDYSIADANSFRIHAYDWTDINGDGKLWADADGNGAVNPGEIDQFEYNRMNYGYNTTNAQELTVGQPRQRIHDGLWLGVQHSVRNPAVPSANLTIRITFYKEVPWSWVTLGASSTVINGNTTYGLHATANVPANAAPGLYEGFIRLHPASGADRGVADETSTQIPVTIAVAANSASFNFAGKGRQNSRFDNNVLWGDMSWGWRQESGDWRFFFADVAPAEAGAGKFWLVNTTWNNYQLPDATVPTDIDTYLYGPSADHYSNGDPAHYGPYTLDFKGGSSNTYLGNGIWAFQTASGTTEEWVAGSLSSGLNEVMIRTTNFNGRRVDEPFNGKSGVLSVNPYPLVVTQTCGVNLDAQVSSTLAISPVQVLAAGLSQTITSTQTITSNQFTDYSFTLSHPALLDVQTVTGGATPAQDVDIFVYRVEGGSLIPIGSSTGGTSDEHVTQLLPQAGEYLIRMFGFAVSPNPGTVLLVLNNIDGTDLTITDPPAGINPGQPVALHLKTSSNLAPGDYNGAVVLGPSVAPGAAFIPVTVHVSGDCPTMTPTPTQTPTPTPRGDEPYTDVNDGDYFHLAVNWLYGRGATDALPAGSTTFQPYQNASRAVIVKMAVLGNGFTIDTSGGQHFSDVPATNPYYDYIMTAWHRGIISGYNTNPPCGANSPCFLPNDNVTRGQIAKIVVKAQGWTVVNPATPTFADVPANYPFYTVIETLFAHYAISGYDCGGGSGEPCGAGNQPYYRPGNPATRGQVAKIVFLAVTTPPRK